MPNEVFLRTRAGLSAMVSARAADRILEGALKNRGRTPEDVDLPQMQSALLGPVFRELQGVLPRAGLRRNLERLARSLLQETEAGGSVEDRNLSASNTEATSVDRSAEPEARAPLAGAEAGESLAQPERDPPTAHPEPPDRAAAEPEPSSAAGTSPAVDAPANGGSPGRQAAALGEPVDESDSSDGTQPGTAEQRPLDAEELEDTVRKFAQIEQVRMVAVIRQDGSLALSRGEGLDVALLTRLSRLSLTLLAKSGAVRQVHLGHTGGQLFLFPARSDLLVVFGAADLNLGAVSTAYQSASALHHGNAASALQSNSSGSRSPSGRGTANTNTAPALEEEL